MCVWGGKEGQGETERAAVLHGEWGGQQARSFASYPRGGSNGGDALNCYESSALDRRWLGSLGRLCCLWDSSLLKKTTYAGGVVAALALYRRWVPCMLPSIHAGTRCVVVANGTSSEVLATANDSMVVIHSFPSLLTTYAIRLARAGRSRGTFFFLSSPAFGLGSVGASARSACLQRRADAAGLNRED